ncbi:ThiF family adenylyltransferase [Ferrovibrio sp.]|uniref:ThiF family adenylyltransferase n=1 Tax=Ferrovibrio sp. TaxID=1917215 RepID=UPI003D2CC40E
MANEEALRDVLSVLGAYHNASNIQRKERPDGGTEIIFDLKVRKPPKGFANGVRATETVWLVLPPGFPLESPFIWLRQDFSRALPHINPHSSRPKPGDDFVEPCVIDEPLPTFFHYNGFAHLLHRIQKWLDDAAFDSLARDDRYWEPIRRNGLSVFLTARRDALARHITDKKGRAYLPTLVSQGNESVNEFQFCGIVADYENMRPDDLIELAADRIARAATILLWGKNVVGSYLPDTVKNFTDLEKLAEQYGCKSVTSSITPLVEALNKSARNVSFFVFVIFAVKRPKPLPGSFGGDDKPEIEYIPYVCALDKREIVGRGGFQRHFQRPDWVIPFGLHYDISPEILQKTSGISYSNDGKRLTLLGCGSLGSKVAIHLGKSGFGNIDLIDRGRLSPHNLARMGIVNERFSSGLPKAVAVRAELGLLGHRGTPNVSFADAVEDLCSEAGLEVSEKSALLLDATASINVHNALCKGNLSRPVRIAQASFLANGRAGLLIHEGNERSPDLEDLKTEFWRYWAEAPKAEHVVWKAGVKQADRIRVGEGCESMSMVMSDMAASLLTAGISQDVSRLMRIDALPIHGRVSFGIASEDGRSVVWKDSVLEPSIILQAENGWEVRILPALARIIDARARRSKELETGGYLVGRINPAIRRITLAADVPPPPDSIHRKNRFILGKEGAREALMELCDKSRGAFLAVGTWHSHPMGGGESDTDIGTLQDIARDFCGTPAVSLIWRPEGYHAVVEQIWGEAKVKT